MKGRSALVPAAALLLAACIGPSLDQLLEAADAWAVPADWELVVEERADRPCLDPVENCPKVDRTYRVPGTADFAVVITDALGQAGFDVWNPPRGNCGPMPERGCTAGARRTGVSLRATVVDVAADAYVVTVRASEYVGP